MATSFPGVFTASLPELYEQFLVGPLFRPFAEELLRRAGLRAQDRLLDVACGTGIVARLAQQVIGDYGAIAGVDTSPGMLAVARTVAPSIDWREGDATRLPIAGDHSFDLITCHQGLQFFSDKPAAIREMHRVVRPDGRVAIGTWRPMNEVPLVRDLHQIAERHVGPIVDVRHSLGDSNAIASLLGESGFRTTDIETVIRTIRINSEVFARLNTMAVVGMSPLAKTMNDDQRANAIATVAAESIQAMRPYLEGNELVFAIASNIAIARMS